VVPSSLTEPVVEDVHSEYDELGPFHSFFSLLCLHDRSSWILSASPFPSLVSGIMMLFQTICTLLMLSYIKLILFQQKQSWKIKFISRCVVFTLPHLFKLLTVRHCQKSSPPYILASYSVHVDSKLC
jgi:hypothetical protein